jgi:hypothetical protein
MSSKQFETANGDTIEFCVTGGMLGLISNNGSHYLELQNKTIEEIRGWSRYWARMTGAKNVGLFVKHVLFAVSMQKAKKLS